MFHRIYSKNWHLLIISQSAQRIIFAVCSHQAAVLESTQYGQVEDVNISRKYSIDSISKCPILDYDAELMLLDFQQHSHELF